MKLSSSSCANPASDIDKGGKISVGMAWLGRLLKRPRGVAIGLWPRLSSFSLIVLVLVLITLIFAPSTRGQMPHNSQPIGITEKMGQTVPAQLIFFDEQGREVILGSLIKRPTILALVYYRCGRFCPQLLAAMAAVFPQLGLKADDDYQVITVSFDESDTPAVARDLKRNYLKAIQNPFPADAWRFLSGNRRNIQGLCAAVGFTFQKEMHGFAHPVALIILSPHRKISRYIHVSKFFYGVGYPIAFSALELSQALTDAAKERVGLATSKEFLYCFPHEPKQEINFFKISGIFGAVTIVCLAVFFVYLSVTGRKTQKGKRS
jgi:protein SCO1/2